jgi:putative transposase
LTGVIKDLVEQDIKMLCEWKDCEVIELNVQPDHVHLVVSIPPKVCVSILMGTLKGKLVIKLFKSCPKLKQKPYWGNHFWSRGYFVNTVGINEDQIRRYVKYQEDEDKKEENNRDNYTLFE